MTSEKVQRNRRSTGIEGLDRLIRGPRPGDNVVLQVDCLSLYRDFCRRAALRGGGPGDRLAYFRFARHESLLTEEECTHLGVEIRRLPLDQGFEHFITTAHSHILELGQGAVLFFDSLSELSDCAYSDRMIGNFFQLTCPLVLRTGSLAWFALVRNVHSYHAVTPLQETTQIFLDLYGSPEAPARPETPSRDTRDTRDTRDKPASRDNCKEDHPEDQDGEVLYLRPVKTDGRNDDAEGTLFCWNPRQDSPRDFRAVSDSDGITTVLNQLPWPGLPSAGYRQPGVWDRTFLQARECSRDQSLLLRLIVAREGPVFELARRFFSVADLQQIWRRMIGTGFIGGKAVGMLLARAILLKKRSRWERILEPHDSFFVGSDVYYTFLVINNCWWDRQRQKDPETFLEGSQGVRHRMLQGRFPRYIMTRFAEMLDYFGTSPIIVRSSSLLEDNFGNAFAGTYESVFCTMQGNREERLQEFLAAVLQIYASTISDTALRYRRDRGILDQDEQMALLVQRVSGSAEGGSAESGAPGLHCRGRWFFPHLAGVAFSFNPYAWHPEIDPRAGVLRLVFGLGTRAVDRSDDDYTRVVALNAPERRPEAGGEEIRRHTQRRVDLLDLQEGRETSRYFSDLIPDLTVQLDQTGTARVLPRVARRERRTARPVWTLTFDPFFRETSFVADMRDLLETLREAYGTDVDVEFTVQLGESGGYRVNLVQCRPLQIQVQKSGSLPEPFPEPHPRQVLLRTSGGVVGCGGGFPVSRILLVSPRAYAELSTQDRYELPGVLRAVTKEDPSSGPGALVLLGPGRWGTTMPSLGVPVQVSDLGTAAVLCEIDQMHQGLIADMSLGTHFFHELVERNLLYLAVRLGQEGTVLDLDWLESQENCLDQYVPPETALRWGAVLRVLHFGAGLKLVAESSSQRALLYFKEGAADTYD
ncbi:Pyruvate phosphate dikinase, PEP/pyruvate binding domain [Alkalispirochaeta americana]|uniref:Pyruvate phosphate dikinase, PEP/pyruvate binding domain n=1 Tax=Alkalispirochaeta americana TaxID=159291 RepID=A0A1N6S075_9SPIO|nr:PEP/pyruvate-binding domain-containing protein [Alkalispirochaeta americana]SIQ34523.1 Pyruvate phosphate dikinase, PEP/pyruvate binding domain [Alkalispirochaeta americana]